MNLNDVKNLNQKRMVAENSLEQKNIQNLIETAVRKEINLPRLDEAEQLVFKIRTELIDYIIEHGLVQGFEFDGNDYPIQNGKIVITKEMIKMVTDKFNYLDESEAEKFINQIMDEQFVVRDQNYVHTDNNFTDEDVNKLNGIEEGAEVNKVIDVTVDGETVLDNSDRIAKITKEIIKKSYESNENTNAFTDAEKTKLAGISDGAEVNRVDDVLVNGRSVLNEQKQAIVTKEIIKEAYESNENTNAFTDAEKEKLKELGKWQGQIDGELETLNNDLEELGNTVNQNTNTINQQGQKLNTIEEGAQVNKVEDVKLDGTSVLNTETKIANITKEQIKNAYESNQNTNVFTDAEKTKLQKLGFNTLNVQKSPSDAIEGYKDLENGTYRGRINLKIFYGSGLSDFSAYSFYQIFTIWAHPNNEICGGNYSKTWAETNPFTRVTFNASLSFSVSSFLEFGIIYDDTQNAGIDHIDFDVLSFTKI